MEEIVESVNPMDLDPYVSGSSEPARSEHVSTETLSKNSQDMARVFVTPHPPPTASEGISHGTGTS